MSSSCSVSNELSDCWVPYWWSTFVGVAASLASISGNFSGVPSAMLLAFVNPLGVPLSALAFVCLVFELLCVCVCVLSSKRINLLSNHFSYCLQLRGFQLFESIESVHVNMDQNKFHPEKHHPVLARVNCWSTGFSFYTSKLWCSLVP